MSGGKRGDDGYEVGYGKPPKSTRFEKGRSGNPRGRPKVGTADRKPLKYEITQETFKDVFLDEAYRMVSINTGSGEESLPIARAVTRALGVKAAKGHIYAQRLFAQTLIALEAENRRNSQELMDGLINYKKKWSEELQRRAEHNLPIDPPVPHPDDVVIDIVCGTVEVRGPLTPEEKERREYYAELLEEWEETKAHYEEELAQPVECETEPGYREFAANELVNIRKIIPMLEMLSGKSKSKAPTLFEAKKLRERIE